MYYDLSDGQIEYYYYDSVTVSSRPFMVSLATLRSTALVKLPVERHLREMASVLAVLPSQAPRQRGSGHGLVVRVLDS